MRDIVDWFRDNPWIWFFLAAGLIVWIAALRLVLTSPKFRRKGWWVLLSLLTFAWSWSVGPHGSVSLGFPVGALYILWFWRWGPEPPPLPEGAAAKPLPAPASAWRVMVLRVAYFIGAGAMLLMSWGAIGEMKAMFAKMQPPAEIAGMLDAMLPAQIGMVVVFAAGFVFLAFRPYWWAKLICALATVSWIGNVTIASAMLGFTGYSAAVLVAGLIMLGVLITHQIVDPRWSGSYLRAG